MTGSVSATASASSPPADIGCRFEITDSFTVDAPERCRRLRLWAPVIPDVPHQRVLDLAVRADLPAELTREAEFGNTLLHATAPAPTAGRYSFELRYAIKRVPRPGTTDPARATALASPELFARTLQPERHVDVDDRTRALAAEIVAGETNPLEQARRIYDHTTGAMTYDATQQSYRGSTEHALVCQVGNCNDIHALFVSLCRSVGIPARFVLGQALEAPTGTAEDCEVCGYHCWAEFFIAGLGWLPADASCACKYGTHGLFGRLECNHIAFSTGRDLLFDPPQHAGRALFFAAPYAEADGAAVPVERRLAFTEAP
ncbi:transglutaminase-like domain-containing protein [Streptomyces halobius]|uniref:Transglutaminase domain-containing protein n=1 Tax=Streptomyces halobius TaxID=2879846 RepID=A0ABY4M3X4_9ACTN|nr:transglutaminase domain-containing protein [Streptomyces halobius]UQA91953.1 transglutaminase domain-containing protein [Streptomyces halobius]